MGEAKRRKEKGLPPRTTKKEKKAEKKYIPKNFRRNQILPVILAAGFVVFLIFDLVRYYIQWALIKNGGWLYKDSAERRFISKGTGVFTLIEMQGKKPRQPFKRFRLATLSGNS